MAQSSEEQIFYKFFIDAQFRQNPMEFIKTSSCFQVLSSLKDGVEMSMFHANT